MVVYTSRVVIMKEHIPFCKKHSIRCIGYSVLLTVLSNFERKPAIKDSAF